MLTEKRNIRGCMKKGFTSYISTSNVKIPHLYFLSQTRTDSSTTGRSVGKRQSSVGNKTRVRPQC